MGAAGLPPLLLLALGAAVVAGLPGVRSTAPLNRDTTLRLPPPPPPPGPAKPLPGDAGPCGTHEECEVIMALFGVMGPNTSVVQRHVDATPSGYTATTSSANATVASWLKVHVESMRRRVVEGRPINTWDPFYAAIFNASARAKLTMAVRNTSDGVSVTEVGKSPCAAALLAEHAAEVSRFVTRGMAEMSGPAHPVPAECPWHAAQRKAPP